VRACLDRRSCDSGLPRARMRTRTRARTRTRPRRRPAASPVVVGRARACGRADVVGVRVRVDAASCSSPVASGGATSAAGLPGRLPSREDRTGARTCSFAALRAAEELRGDGGVLPPHRVAVGRARACVRADVGGCSSARRMFTCVRRAIWSAVRSSTGRTPAGRRRCALLEPAWMRAFTAPLLRPGGPHNDRNRSRPDFPRRAGRMPAVDVARPDLGRAAGRGVAAPSLRPTWTPAAPASERRLRRHDAGGATGAKTQSRWPRHTDAVMEAVRSMPGGGAR
jgi:hypothetical protein